MAEKCDVEYMYCDIMIRLPVLIDILRESISHKYLKLHVSVSCLSYTIVNIMPRPLFFSIVWLHLIKKFICEHKV